MSTFPSSMNHIDYTYALITAAVSSFVWAPILQEVNLWLTTFTLAGGLILLALKLVNEYKYKQKKDNDDDD